MFVVEVSVTEKCNLGCPYCYVANKPNFMTPEVFDKAYPSILEYAEKSGGQKYSLSYFGGEPLLNFDLIKYIHNKVKNDPMCSGEVIISNMTMVTPEIVDYIKSEGLGVSWSFDGLGSNESRPLLQTPENKGYKNILEIYNKKKELILSCTSGCKVMIWSGNMRGMDKNLDYFLDFGITSPDFSIVRDAVWTRDDVDVFAEECRKLADRWMYYLERGKYCSVGFFMLYIIDTVYGLTYGKRPFGCFACSHGCAITSSGDFYPCQRFASKKLMKYTPDWDFKYYSNLLNPINYKECQQCDLYRICNCGCVYSQLANGNKPVECVCDLLHILYSESFRVLHLMKHNETFKQVLKNYFNRK